VRQDRDTTLQAKGMGTMKPKDTRANMSDETLIEQGRHAEARHVQDALVDAVDDADRDAAVHELYEALVEQIGQLRETYAGLDSYHLVEGMPLLTAALHLLDDVEAGLEADLDPEDDSDSQD
jgi:hypothetical protein